MRPEFATRVYLSRLHCRFGVRPVLDSIRYCLHGRVRSDNPNSNPTGIQSQPHPVQLCGLINHIFNRDVPVWPR